MPKSQLFYPVDPDGHFAIHHKPCLGQQISCGNIFKHPANIFMEGQESALFYGWKTDGLVQPDEVADYPISGAQAGDIKIVLILMEMGLLINLIQQL